MKRRNKSITAVTLTMAMALAAALSGCSGSGGNGTNASEAGNDSAAKTETNAVDEAAGDDTSEEPVTLTIWNTEVLSPGIQTSEVAKEIEKKLGIKMDIVQGDAQKFSLLVAGGDLPDIIYTNPAQQGVDANTLISGGHVIPLDDLIEEYGENIKKNFPDRLEYSRQFASNGENKVYFLPVNGYIADEENPDISLSIANVGLMIRWDVYEAIGHPEIKTTDDFLNVLKEMQDYAREQDLADGKTIYAISGWSDWGLWPWYLANVREMGYDDLANGTILNRETDTIESMYNSEAFWESLEFYNKAYNMGILDPEAFTMKNDQFWEKCNNGQVLMAYASWQTDSINDTLVANGHADWGFEKVPFDGYKYISGIVTPNAPLGKGADYANAITTNCKYPEKAIQLLDYLNSEEGARLVYSGIEGTHWEYDENGEPVPTDELIEMTKTDADYRTKTGLTMYNKMCGFSELQILSDGGTADLLKSNSQKTENLTDVDKAYCEYFTQQLGKEITFPGEALYEYWQKGEVNTINEYILYPTLVQAPSAETLNILAQCDQYMNVQGVKCIMAATQEEFDAARAEAMESLSDKNYDKAAEEIQKLYDEARSSAQNFELHQ